MLLYVKQRNSQLDTIYGTTVFTAGIRAAATAGTATAGTHQSDPVFAGGAASLGVIPTLAR